MCQYDEDSAIGLVINREAPIRVTEVLDQLGLPSHTEAAALWGGPVGAGVGFVIWQGQVDEDLGWNVGAGIAVSQSEDVLRQLVQQGTPFQLAIGYAGWGPEQLDGELESGSWLFTEVDADLIMHTPVDDRYDQAVASLGVPVEAIWMTPVDE